MYGTPDLPVNLIGVPTQVLQQRLAEAQQAYHDVSVGNKIGSASYTQGDGSRSVVRNQTDIAALTSYIRQLVGVLYPGQGRRRSIGVVF